MHTHFKEQVRVTRAPVSIKQDRTGIKVSIPEELPVGNIIRRVTAPRVAKINNACNSIVTDEDMFREPVAVEQARWCRPHMLISFEKLGCQIDIGPAYVIGNSSVGGTVVPFRGQIRR